MQNPYAQRRADVWDEQYVCLKSKYVYATIKAYVRLTAGNETYADVTSITANDESKFTNVASITNCTTWDASKTNAQYATLNAFLRKRFVVKAGSWYLTASIIVAAN